MTSASATLDMPEWLSRRALLTPDRTALVCAGERWTFHDLERRVSATVSHLREAELRPGDRAALLADNGAGFVQAVHAVARVGAVLVPLNTRLAEPELLAIVRDCRPALLLHDRANGAAAESVSNVAGVTRLGLDKLTAPGGASAGSNPCGTINLESVHTIVYTSGTSGRAKGAMLTFGNHWWSATASALNLGLRDNDRWLACLPLFHVGGLAILLRSVIYGMTVVLHSRFDPEAVNQAIDEDGVTIVSVVANMLQRMLEARGNRPYPPSLRCVLAGGGPVPRDLLEECARRDVPVVQTYGLTEASSQATTLSPDDAMRRLGSAGKPLFPVEVRIENADGAVLPPGEAGEILLRGPTVTTGYFERPEDTRQAIRDGWLHTGDVGYLDQDGYLYVLDRRDDLIVSGGENVYPAEVEETIRAHPGVTDAGVFGLPDPVWGQRVAAAVVPGESGLGREEILAFCRERLAPYKVPGEILMVTALPRNAAGKLLRRELRLRFGR